jgi:IclR family transcriptional regulator, KDG regulon repressor
MVKSAVRALAILEFLKQSTSGTVGDVCSALGYPNSSTSVMLKTMLDAGYLDYDSIQRRYKPSYRVALLGEGIVAAPLVSEMLRERLNQLQKWTGETVLVGMQNGAYVQYVHVLTNTPRLLERLPIGKMRLMSYNPLGEALLALLDDRRVSSIFRHNNANWPDPATRLSESVQWQEIRAIRERGYAEGPGRTWPKARILAVAIRPRQDMPRISVAVGGIGTKLAQCRDEILEALRAF